MLEWVNYDCPFVKKQYHNTHKKMQTLQKTYTGRGVIWLSICSSAEGKQGYMVPEAGKQRLADLGAAPTALLFDYDGRVGKLYTAKTTPDMRIINPQGEIVYVGAIDSVRSKHAGDVHNAKNYVELVLDSVLAGEKVPVSRRRPYGCSIKYAK